MGSGGRRSSTRADTGGVLYQLFEWLPGHGPDNPLTEFEPAE